MNSKRKGGLFEREVCKAFSLWVTGGQSDDLFWRSAMSGGRATLQYQKGEKNQMQSGDICAIHSDGWEKLLRYVVVECKSHHNLDLRLSFLQRRGRLVAFWEKLYNQAVVLNREPMLVAREFRTPTLLITSLTAAARLKLDVHNAPLRLEHWLRKPLVFLFDKEIVPGKSP